MEEKELLPGIECGSGNRVFITELLDCHMGQIIITQDGEDKNQTIRTIRNDDFR